MGEHDGIEEVKAAKLITCGGYDIVYVTLIIAEGGVITFKPQSMIVTVKTDPLL